MKKIICVIFTTLVLLPLNDIFSCSCGGWDSFLTRHKNADIVCVVKVESYKTFRDDGMPLSMGVSILNLVQGSELKESITIWGDRGWDCAPYLEKFQQTSTWLFALNKIEDSTYFNSPGLNLGDYIFLGCCESYLEVIDTIAYGYIFEENLTTSIPSQNYPLKDLIDIIQGTTDISSEGNNSLDKFILFQNYPNPFNPHTEISYYLAENSYVKIEIVNLLGENISIIESEYKNAGYHHQSFDGSEYPSGMYLCRIFTNNNLRSAIKMVLLK